MNDLAVMALSRLKHWHQRRVLGGLSRVGMTINLPVNGVRILLDPRHDYVQWQMVSNRAWERPVEELIGEISRGSRLVFDVGANIGYFSLLSASRMPPGATVVAFEPYPPNFDLLRKNTQMNGFDGIVRCEGLAISASPGPVRLYYGEWDSNSGTPSMLGRDGEGGRSMEARSTSLDAYREEHFPGEDVDLVKVDVEGGEYEVLLGMEAGLRAGRYRKIIVEVHPAQLGLAGKSPAMILDRLAGFGYAAREIGRDGLEDAFELKDETQKFLFSR